MLTLSVHPAIATRFTKLHAQCGRNAAIRWAKNSGCSLAEALELVRYHTPHNRGMAVSDAEGPWDNIRAPQSRRTR